MNSAEWQEGIEQWKTVKKQALINLAQSELYIKAIEDKIKSLPKSNEEEK